MAIDDGGDNQSTPAGWIAFSIGCAVFLAAAIGLMATFGVPGTSGGSSPNQQSAGAPVETGGGGGSTTGQGGSATTGQGTPQSPASSGGQQQSGEQK